MNQQPLQLQMPVQGWKQFLTARKEMLDALDLAREKDKSRRVKTAHGKVAEAAFRRWLSSFLPKRYGVTSGYVISPGLKDTDEIPHFDVIIYDQLETPILWADDSPDTSSQGRSLAIPAENVLMIIEVKSRFTTTTVQEALTHLALLVPLMSNIDEPSNRYKLYLPAKFCCGLAFFDLYKEDAFSKTGLNKIATTQSLRGFFGGIILRGEGNSKPTGRIHMLVGDTPIESRIGKGKEKVSLFGMGLSDTTKISDNQHIGAMLSWAEPFFAQFAFDILAILKGSYEPGRVSSFHGMGASDIDNW